jgi:S-adenosylmethionine:tRNA ribosyltransferase-isomerase
MRKSAKFIFYLFAYFLIFDRMLITDLDFELPERLIAQEPAEKRENSRMLVLDRASRSFSDERFFHFPRFLRAGDVLVLNNTKVFPARLYGKTETGARAEVFLVREIKTHIWETLARPARRLKNLVRRKFNGGSFRKKR